MKTDARTPGKRARDRGRVVYRLTGEQVLMMIEKGIIDGDDVELWDGVLYKMTKEELHHLIVMATAEALRPVISRDYYVREEKSSKDGAHSLPEPDVAVARGKLGDTFPDPPSLGQFAMVIEVDHHTARADGVVKSRRYAARGIPVYWIIKARRRIVQVHDAPRGSDGLASYSHVRTFSGDDEIPIVIDGNEVGCIATSALFPMGPQP